MRKTVTVLVNSTDSYEDAWYPFFKLFATYWPACESAIVLNTETKSFRYLGLQITASRVGKYWSHNRQMTWSECLLRCLAIVNTPLILYLQEDFFLDAPVEVAQLREFAEYMIEHQIAHIGLTHFGSHGPFHPTDHPLLWEVDRHARYRIALQAGLWNVRQLSRHIRPHENPWQLESYGSRRAARIDDRFLCVNRDVFHDGGRRVIPYEPTGIVGGQWKQEVVEALFDRHQIHVDFTERGFCDPSAPRQFRPLTPARIYSRLKSMF